MREVIEDLEIGQFGHISIETEEGYIYPRIWLEGHQGTIAELSLQATSVKEIMHLSNRLNEIAFKLLEKGYKL